MKSPILATILATSLAVTCYGAPITEEATVEGHYSKVVIAPDGGCVVEEFVHNGSGENTAGPLGLLQEGFGVGNYYVPARRLNERLEGFDDNPDQPILRYSYDCDGPNIGGIHVIRTMEPIPSESAIRVTWRIEHRGQEAQWIAPWVECDWAAGGSVQTSDRLDIPTVNGVRDITQNGYVRPSRNWAAATDPAAKSTVYGVFNANETFAVLAERTRQGKAATAIKTHFTPRRLNPGDVWDTTYRVNMVRGLTHIDFACEEFAVQVDYADGKLTLRLASPRTLPEMQLNAVIVDAAGEAVNLPPKKFTLDPNTVIRCTYDWVAPTSGTYELLGQITTNDRPFTLGKETASPHGGIDTQFVVGNPRAIEMTAWTDAPYALEQGPRTLERNMAAAGDTAVWFESSLNKIFRDDQPKPTGRIVPTGRIALARNESESIQLIVRPPSGAPLRAGSIQVGSLMHASGRGEISSANIDVRRAAYVPVSVPSYFEGPTGLWPDPLVPARQFDAAGGQCTPIWITIRAPKDAKPGTYTGLIELQAGEAPVELWLEAEVFDFALPDMPALKTDFGFSPAEAMDQCRDQGFNGNIDSLANNYNSLALAHRVTLRQAAALPAESADYAASLKKFEARLASLRSEGASAFAVPPSLLGFPEQLALANKFVRDHDLEGRVYVPLAQDPPQPAWPQVYDDATAWHNAAPNIPVVVSTFGMRPFLTDAAQIWSVHLPLLDTTNNRAILEFPAEGGEVWCYIDHAPPRPYPNFFIDFAAMEHRILFWQTRLLGFRGVQYWAVNATPASGDPWRGSTDVTPVNGDGLLIYPSAQGPVPSIRLANIRDGIEDYDYLALLSQRLEAAKKRGESQSKLQQAVDAGNLENLVTSLVSFSREPSILESKRREIAAAIVALGND